MAASSTEVMRMRLAADCFSRWLPAVSLSPAVADSPPGLSLADRGHTKGLERAGGLARDAIEPVLAGPANQRVQSPRPAPVHARAPALELVPYPRYHRTRESETLRPHAAQ